jgi:hypothetical protein
MRFTGDARTQLEFSQVPCLRLSQELSANEIFRAKFCLLIFSSVPNLYYVMLDQVMLMTTCKG